LPKTKNPSARGYLLNLRYHRPHRVLLNVIACGIIKSFPEFIAAGKLNLIINSWGRHYLFGLHTQCASQSPL